MFIFICTDIKKTFAERYFKYLFGEDEGRVRRGATVLHLPISKKNTIYTLFLLLDFI